jgi:hypothetical protein
MTAEEVLHAIEVSHGEHYVWAGQCPGGEVGAHFALTPDGRRHVFKCSESHSSTQEFALVAERVQRLRDKGYLAPRYYSPATFDGGVALFQDAVPGAWSDEVDDELIETALTLNDLQADEGDHSNSWHNYLASTLTEGAAGYCIHDT